MPMNETMRTVITLLVWGSACATTDELIARGDLLAACNRRDAALLTHLANDPAGYFAARVEGELLTLEELVVAGDTRRLSGPTIPGWREVRSPARALALLGGQRPPPEPVAPRRSSLATAGAVLGTITGVLPAASVIARRDLVTPAFTGPAEPPDWQPPDALLVEGKRLRVYERAGSSPLRGEVSVFATWRFGERCRRETTLTWALGESLEASLRQPPRRLGCALDPPRCQ